MLIFLLSSLIVFLLIVLWLLLAPVQLIIDSTEHIYEVKWKSIGIARYLFEEEPVFHLQILFWKKDFNLLEIAAKSKRQNKKKQFANKKRQPISLKKMKQVFRSIKIEKLWLNLDTGDFILNSFLAPVFYFIDRNRKRIQINYQGENQLQLIITMRPAKVLWAIIR